MRNPRPQQAASPQTNGPQTPALTPSHDHGCFGRTPSPHLAPSWGPCHGPHQQAIAPLGTCVLPPLGHIPDSLLVQSLTSPRAACPHSLTAQLGNLPTSKDCQRCPPQDPTPADSKMPGAKSSPWEHSSWAPTPSRTLQAWGQGQGQGLWSEKGANS